jgi:predicted amidophosphoribosyltransferase
MRVCADCKGELEAAYRFCPWCAAPQRRKLVEFFRAHPRDAGQALRVSRYLTEDPHVRFSVWSADGVAEAAVSLDEHEAARLAAFLNVPEPERHWVERVLGRRAAAYLR